MVASSIAVHPWSWAGQTYAEIQATGERQGSILVVPVGSTEQHGHHLPVGTDTLLVDQVANTTAERVHEDLPLVITPPVWTGYSPHHLSFGGTITLAFEHLRTVLEDIAESALKNGFDSLLLLNGHGGNASLVASAASTIGTAQPEVEINALTYFDLASEFIDDIRESEAGGMAHGGEFETSLMLHLYPDLVNTDAIQGTLLDEPYDHGIEDLVESGPLTTYRPFSAYSDSGAIGEPELASAEKGSAILSLLVDELAALLVDIHEMNS